MLSSLVWTKTHQERFGSPGPSLNLMGFLFAPYNPFMNMKTALLRALEWRAVSIVIDFSIVYAITGKFALSAGIIGASNTVRTIAHAFWIKRRGHD